jgi:hypothetical protein
LEDEFMPVKSVVNTGPTRPIKVCFIGWASGFGNLSSKTGLETGFKLKLGQLIGQVTRQSFLKDDL